MDDAHSQTSGNTSSGGEHRFELLFGIGRFFHDLSLTRAGLAFFGVVHAREHTQHDVDDVIDRRMAKHPFGQALQEETAAAEKYAYGDSTDWLRTAPPQKAGAHLKPPQPQHGE